MHRSFIRMVLALATLSAQGCGSAAEDRESTSFNANSKDGGPSGRRGRRHGRSGVEAQDLHHEAPAAQAEARDASSSEARGAETSETPPDASKAQQCQPHANRRECAHRRQRRWCSRQRWL